MNTTLFWNNYWIITGLTLTFTFLIDLVIGDPKTKYHPVMIIGKTISRLKSKLRTGKKRFDKFLGILMLILAILMFCSPNLLLQVMIWDATSLIISINELPSIIIIVMFSFLSGFLLKWTIGLKSLGQATLPISESLLKEDLEEAKNRLSYIVRRDARQLSVKHVISATVECIAESSTDGVTSVIWFYLMGNAIGAFVFIFINQNSFWLLLGIPSAYAFRVINTADSVVGYRDEENINIGCFSARMDDISNYIPTRLTVLCMFVVGKVLKKDIKNAWKVIKSERKSLESPNAGWTMGAMAGLLGVQLEKIDHYKLGNPKRKLEVKDIKNSFIIIVLSVLLFSAFVSLIEFIVIFLVRMI